MSLDALLDYTICKLPVLVAFYSNLNVPATLMQHCLMHIRILQ